MMSKNMLLVLLFVGCTIPAQKTVNQVEIDGSEYNLFGRVIKLGTDLPGDSNTFTKRQLDGPPTPGQKIWLYYNDYFAFHYDTISGKIVTILAGFKPGIVTPIKINGIEFDSSMTPEEVYAIGNKNSFKYEEFDSSSSIHIIQPGKLIVSFVFNPNESPARTMTALYLYEKER